MLSTAKLFSRKVFPVDTESVDTKTSFMSMVQILLSYNYLWFQQLINAITLYFNLHLKICYVSCSVVSDSFATPWTVACQAPLIHGILQARITGVGSHSLLQGIFLTQGLNPSFLPCRHILYCLSQMGSPKIC